MGEVIPFNDSLRSLVAGLGTNRDKMTSTEYGWQYLSDEQLYYAYRSNWMPKKIVKIPAEDAVSEGRDWQGNQDQIELIEAEEGRLGFWSKLMEAQIKARLWGGSAIYIGTGEQNTAEPLDPARVGKMGLKYLTVLSRRDVVAGAIDQDPTSENFGRPAYYDIIGTSRMARVHPSRMAIFVGEPHIDPLLTIGMNHGWGDSVLDGVYSAFKNADATAANIASLVFEANVDVFGIPDLMANLSDPQYEARLLARFALSSTAKGINRALIRDTGEEYDRKQIAFSTLPEVLQKFLEIGAGASDIPLTRFLMTSPSGLGSNGDHSMKMYHKRLATQQKLVITPAIYRLDECMIRSALGSRPKEIYYRWSPLDGMSEKEQAEVGKIQAETTEIYGRTGIFMSEELRKAATNQIVENGIYPGFDQIIEDTGEGFDLGADKPEAEEVVPGAEQVQTGDAAPRTLYVQRKVINAAEIIRWAKGQGFETTLKADDLHVTITFSRKAVDWMKMGSAWDDEIKIPRGGARLIEQFGDATVLLFASNMLTWRHREMVESGATWDHPEYQPHITISWGGAPADLASIEPYQGEIILGPELFSEVKEDWKATIEEV